MPPQRRTSRNRERGVVLMWTAFFLLTMLGFVALGIDVAKLMATRTQLQNAADAAALAGASAVDFDAKDVLLVQDTATVRAQAIAALNKAFVDAPEALVLATGDVSFPAANQVQVTVRRDPASGGAMVTHIAQVLGINSLDVKATAVAEADRPRGVCEGMVPLGAIETTKFKVGCDTTYTLKLDGTISPGNFLLLDFPDCDEGMCQGTNGGNEIRCEVGHGYSCCLHIGDEIMTKPGGTVGAFIQGIDDRWDADTDQKNECYDQYTGNGMRVINVPIFTEFDPNGKKPLVIEGFASFFLGERPSTGKGLTGHFINYPVVGDGNGPPGSGSNTQVYVHLIK